MIEHLGFRIALYAGGIYLFLNIYAALVSDKMLFVPQSASYTHLPNEVRISTTDGQSINAVYLNHPDAPYTLLFSHGNAEDLGNVVPFMRQFHDLGYSVLMYDYRGYGTSDGAPSYRNALDDADAAYRWLVEERGIAPKQIIAHGRSLGGALAVWIASRHETGGLIMECSFASAFRVRTRWPLLPWDKFNNVKAIKKAECPVLLIHGKDDEIIPFWHAQELFKATQEPKRHFWIENGRHNDYAYVADETYLDSILAFLKSLDQETSTPK